MGENAPVVVSAKVTQNKIKRLKQKEKNLKRRINRSLMLLDGDIPQEETSQQPLQPTKYEVKIKKAAKWGKKRVDDWEEWLLTASKQDPRVVDPALLSFKKNA